MNYYKIDYKKLSVLLLPISNRMPIYTAYLSLIASQIQKLQYEFNEFRTSIDASRKTQTCYMRGLLNNYFDHYQRRIQVRTLQPSYDDYLLYEEPNGNCHIISEDEPFLASEILLANHTSFEVVLPIGFDLTKQQEILMKKLLDNNKLPSTTYKITNE